MPDKMIEQTNVLNWFEIPVTDTRRAKAFYESILSVSMSTFYVKEMEVTTFPPSPDGSGRVTGALVKSANHIPAMKGTCVYLNANPAIQDVLDRVETAGGAIMKGKTLIDDQAGYMAHFSDTEGNMVALHASN